MSAGFGKVESVIHRGGKPRCCHRDRAAIRGCGVARRRALGISVGSAFSLTDVFRQQVGFF